MLAFAEPAGVGVEVQYPVTELLVVAVDFLNHLLGAADER